MMCGNILIKYRKIYLQHLFSDLYCKRKRNTKQQRDGGNDNGEYIKLKNEAMRLIDADALKY